MRSLSDVKQGNNCTVKWMFCLPEIMEFMHKYHIEQGSRLQVIQNTRGSMVIGTDNARIALSRESQTALKCEQNRACQT